MVSLPILVCSVFALQLWYNIEYTNQYYYGCISKVGESPGTSLAGRRGVPRDFALCWEVKPKLKTETRTYLTYMFPMRACVYNYHYTSYHHTCILYVYVSVAN